MNRRQTVVALGAAIAAALVAAGGSSAAVAAETRRLLSLPLPTVDPENPSFEVFYRLSQWVAGHEELDLRAGRKLYPVFMAEPWGPKHIAGAFLGLHAALVQDRSAKSVAELVAAGHLPEGETWFVSHLMTTWYLGIYYHQTGTKRMLNEQALMWSRVGRWARIRGVASGVYADWVGPPDLAR